MLHNVWGMRVTRNNRIKMKNDMDDFCYLAAGTLSNGKCYVHLDESSCNKVGGSFEKKLPYKNCIFNNSDRAQERVGAVKLSVPLNSSMREKIIKIELQRGLPPEFKDFVEDLVVITEGLNYYGITDVLDKLREGYTPSEERVKRSGLYDASRPLEPQVRAFELAEGLWGGTKKIMAGYSKGDKEAALVPAMDEARKQKESLDELNNKLKAVLAFAPDSKNHDVWKALMQNPDSIETWEKDYDLAIKKIELDEDIGREQRWKIIFEDKRGCYIDYYPKLKEYQLNSYYSEDE